MFKGADLRALLQSKSADAEPASDVAYALFLEPAASPSPAASRFERLIDAAIKTLQPEPALAHVELLMPAVHPGEPCLFATYIGQSSGWQTDRADCSNFYLKTCVGRWRAVPIFGQDAATRLREECSRELGVAYSLKRYVSAVAPRWVGSLFPEHRRSPAHCASLAARVLANSGVYCTAYSPASYGPSKLHLELCAQARAKAEQMGSAAFATPTVATSSSVEKLVRGVQSKATIDDVGAEGCKSALHFLTVRACAALKTQDASAARHTQKDLATALLRYTILH